jgi:ribosomal protein S18 acetylase RimI-like enzyme
MDNVLIRKLETKDADVICKILADITQTPVKTDFNLIVKAHAQKHEDACFVAELDGRVIGFMISYILTGSFGLEKSAWIAMLGVNPEYMGRGIGEHLAREIFKFYKAQGIDTVYTSVKWDSPDLLSFFKTLGFDRSSFINLRRVL